MQRKQGLGRVLLKPGAIEGQVADLLALGIEQEGAHGWRSHIGPRRGSDGGWSDGGYTCPWESQRCEERGGETRAGGEGSNYFLTYLSLQIHQKFVALTTCAPDVQKEF